MTLAIVDAVGPGGRPLSVRIAGDRLVAVGTHVRPEPGDDVLDARGGAVIPGLHDHHVHLRALAAARRSVDVSPAAVGGAKGFAAALRSAVAAAGGGWVRAVGYHESVAGPLDAAALDAIVGDAPVRVQHRSGALWVFSSAAVRSSGAAEGDGRLWRRDDWVRAHVPREPLDLAAVGAEAAALGITGFTDADPERTPDDLRSLAVLPQRVVAMGPVGLVAVDERVAIGPVKVVLDDDDLPALDDVVDVARAAHAEGRALAVHCVTRAQLVLTVAALAAAGRGPGPGDRIEHGAVIPDELLPELARLDVTVVTQPSFVAERGDDYRRDVEPDDLPLLYRAASLRRAGIAVAAGSDAPYASLDPWAAIRAATTRATAGGAVLGGIERLAASEALNLFAGHPERPGRPRVVETGAIADLTILAAPHEVALADPSADLVRATVARGVLVHTGGDFDRG